MAAQLTLIDADSGEIIVPKLRLATSFWQRFRGLQFQPALAADEGLLLRPCRSIHTHWMRFAIDVVMLDQNGLVLAVQARVHPWRMLSGPKRTRAILETAAESRAGQLVVGNRVAVAANQEHFGRQGHADR